MICLTKNAAYFGRGGQPHEEMFKAKKKNKALGHNFKRLTIYWEIVRAMYCGIKK